MSNPANSQIPDARNPRVFALKIWRKSHAESLIGRARSVFERLLGFEQFNAIYSRLPPCEPSGFPQAFLDEIRAQVEWAGRPADSIPASGPLIAISNHPFGLIEAMAIDSLILSRRPDVTAMAVRELVAIPEFGARYIFVGARGSRRHRNLSVRGWRRSIQWLARGGALLIFPASRVSRFHWRSLSVADEPWSAHVAGLARRTHASVLPIFFHGQNSWLFQLAGIFSPAVQNLLVIGETANKHGWKLRGTVGRVIQPQELASYPTDEEAIAFLRRETEILARS